MSAYTYYKRLVVSLAGVVGASLLILFRGSFGDAVGATWFWLAVVSDVFEWSISIHPAVFGPLTIAALAAAATRRGASIAATGWFVLNVFGGLWFLSVYDGH
jgi:hypothetical protein